MAQWKLTLNGDYEVSDEGQIKRIKPGRGMAVVGKILAPNPLNGGHLTVSCWDASQKKRVRVLIHVLVAEAFLGPCPDGMEVNHKDENPRNNCVSNLEYLTHADNIRHGYRNKRGAKHPHSKLTDSDVAENRRLRSSGVTGVELAKRYGVSQQTICNAYKGRVYS